ncbi:MAG TPA: saccharopine dehydrogenase NADP-binding domain-containing protein [Planctomycetaceae bacterium]|nr:saccharopine dehydrogenase NADP-binding domain-containing protein [Planctomycetaceae bacterium]
MTEPSWIIYGATGYTGRAIAEEAGRRGLRPILAGRNATAIPELARTLGMEQRVFGLDNAAALRQSIRGAKVVLNCAGPFSATARPMMEACLDEHAHYLDITGEIDVIEAAAALDARAKAASVMLLPAIGFDVVPSDCLAARLAARLPGASELTLAFAAMGSLSPGTAKTMLEAVSQGGRVRIDGRLTRVPLAWKTLDVPFREGTRTSMTIPWGDVASAYYSTGIGNIEVYASAPRQQITMLRRIRWAVPVIGLWPLSALAASIVERKVHGPSPESRERDTSSLWGCVQDKHGNRAAATLTTPNGYSLTVSTSLAAVQRLLESSPRNGFLTPSLAFGADFIDSIPGCDFRFDETVQSGPHQTGQSGAQPSAARQLAAP